ncbi:MAG: 3,4-dihydroxy-2-butanone-4-phosphate synthase [Deltaproteobacteria bacterium]|nr:3,4-dihydroxy-2-butanone-4-phosphate synthase [Deltaproteobacteria bacterium]
MGFERVQQAIQAVRRGEMVILVDDEDRENEGDLCVAAEKVTPEAINFMAKFGRGLICLALTEERARALDLPMMVAQNTSPYGTAFTVSIEARHGVTTGISAADRATTILTAVAAHTGPEHLSRPGHVFPLVARAGGVLVRTGQTEGAVDLARLAGLAPAGVICEVMSEDGSMARMRELERFAAEHGLLVVSIADLIEYRLTHESLVRRITSREVEHPHWGSVTLHAYGTTLDERQHLAVVKGDVVNGSPPLVRVHSGYPLSGVFGDLFSNDRQLLNAALMRLGAEERGVLLCLDRGRAETPLAERIRNLGRPAGDAPAVGTLREIGIGAQILRDLGLSRVRLLTNSAWRLAGIEGYGLRVEEVIPLDIGSAPPLPSPKLEVVKAEKAKG